jgi:hypothetical protein
MDTENTTKTTTTTRGRHDRPVRRARECRVDPRALRDAALWSQTRGLLASWESIANDLRTLYRRADDALDSIGTAVDQFRPDVNDPFVKHVLAVLAVRDSAGPLPALLSDVTMGG